MLSRRGLCLYCIISGSFAAGGRWLSPQQAFAQARNIVDFIRSDAANATITVHKLRGNNSVLHGWAATSPSSPDGTESFSSMLEFTASRPRITKALTGLDRTPIRHLINTYWQPYRWQLTSGACTINPSAPAL
jgi:hypothetical protein